MTISVDEIKRIAGGRWEEILERVGGIPREALTGKNTACPKCGGRDRFRFINRDAGAVYCNQCFAKGNGDGIAAVQWATGSTFPDTIKLLGDYLGVANGKPRIVATYDYQDEQGTLLFQVVRFDPKDFRQRKPDGNGGWNWSVKGTRIVPFRLPQLVQADPAEIIFIVEGEKDVLHLERIGAVATCNAGGAGKWRAEHAGYLRGRRVVVLPDNDDAGRKHAAQVAASLQDIADSIRIVELPGLAEKGDVSDWINAGGSLDQLLQLVEAASEWTPTAAKPATKKSTSKIVSLDDQNVVVIGLDESRVADQVIARLAALEGADAVYHRAGTLVAVVPIDDRDLPVGLLRIVQMPQATLRERITLAATLVVETGKNDAIEFEPTCPPKWLVEAIAARGYYPGIRSLSGIVQSPTLRRDGSILQTPGYDDATGLLYSPLSDFASVPESPSRQDAIDAAGKLLAVVADFPFVDDSDRAAWLAMVLTMIGRQAIDGCCPLFAITANTRGAGKGLLADAASIISYGRPAARETFCRDGDELRKRITSIAIEGRAFTLFDNIDSKLSGAALDAAITSRTWSDRVLGRSATTGELPMRTVWAATGNNLLFGGDIARRVLPIRLSSPLENPEDRHDFQHADLLPWVTSQRAELATAALTILRAYFSAGCPRVEGGTWGSFEAWASIIRGSLVWCGLADPMATRDAARSQDDTRETVGLLIAGLLEADQGDGLTAAEICDLVSCHNDAARFPTLAQCIREICGGRIDARTIGNQLRRFAGRVVQDCRITYRTGRGRVRRWRAESVSGDTGDTGDTLFPPSYARAHAGAHTHARTHAHAERPEIESPQSPESPSRVCSCGAAMIPADEINGWRNWDCPACKAVVPTRTAAQAAGVTP